MAQMRSYDDVLLVVGALQAGAVAAQATKMDAAREQGFRMQKLKAAMSFNGKTSDEGPIVVGLCSTDLSTTEIAEVFASDPQKPDDVPASEQVMREVFPIWHIAFAVNAPQESTTPYRNVAYPWKETREGDGLKWFAINLGPAILTTGTLVQISSVCIGEWLLD